MNKMPGGKSVVPHPEPPGPLTLAEECNARLVYKKYPTERERQAAVRSCVLANGGTHEEFLAWQRAQEAERLSKLPLGKRCEEGLRFIKAPTEKDIRMGVLSCISASGGTREDYDIWLRNRSTVRHAPPVTPPLSFPVIDPKNSRPGWGTVLVLIGIAYLLFRR